MGKYFSNDSELVNYITTDDLAIDMTKTVTMPTSVVHNSTENLSESNKKVLEKQSTIKTENIDDKINEIYNQNETIKNHFNQIEKERVKQTFKSFDELEVLERLNQITFLLVQQNSRLDNIENFLKNSSNSYSHTNLDEENTYDDTNNAVEFNDRELEVQASNVNTNSMSPIERHIYETNKSNEIDYMNHDDVRTELNKIQYNQNTPIIPMDGLSDNSINLEETFPDRDPEAYQAAYSTLNELKKQNPHLGYSKSPKGGLNGSNAGF